MDLLAHHVAASVGHGGVVDKQPAPVDDCVQLVGSGSLFNVCVHVAASTLPVTP